jgi:hypothetical protein
MSNISVNTITDASGGSTASINGLTPQASNMQPFNRIINGAMTIDQRNAGASVTQDVSGAQFSVDRWKVYGNVSAKFTAQQNAGGVTAPAGYTNYLGITSLSAYSVAATDEFITAQPIEGLNVSDLGWGTAGAKTVTLSFQVRSSLTGTFGGSVRNSGYNRSFPFSYSIPTANTWTTISINITGDTSGTWLTTNGAGINLSFSLGAGTSRSGTAGAWAAASYVSATGATSVVGTSGATFYITGVQLEAGSTASSFAHENYADTLQKCQRYFVNNFKAFGKWHASTLLRVGASFPVTMRAVPTIVVNNAASLYYENWNVAGFVGTGTESIPYNSNTTNNADFQLSVPNNSVPAQSFAMISNNISATAEL